MRRRLKKEAKLWIRIEATVPVTRKPEGKKSVNLSLSRGLTISIFPPTTPAIYQQPFFYSLTPLSTHLLTGIRMGKGKGNIAFYATPIRPGQILFEMDRVEKSVALQVGDKSVN